MHVEKINSLFDLYENYQNNQCAVDNVITLINEITKIQYTSQFFDTELAQKKSGLITTLFDNEGDLDKKIDIYKNINCYINRKQGIDEHEAILDLRPFGWIYDNAGKLLAQHPFAYQMFSEYRLTLTFSDESCLRSLNKTLKAHNLNEYTKYLSDVKEFKAVNEVESNKEQILPIYHKLHDVQCYYSSQVDLLLELKEIQTKENITDSKMIEILQDCHKANNGELIKASMVKGGIYHTPCNHAVSLLIKAGIVDMNSTFYHSQHEPDDGATLEWYAGSCNKLEVLDAINYSMHSDHNDGEVELLADTSVIHE